MSLFTDICSKGELNKSFPKASIINKRYIQLELIDSGGLSDVYLGNDIYDLHFDNDQKIALKIPSEKISSMDDVIAFTYAEYNFLKQLKSDNIVSVLNFDIHKKTKLPFLVLEYIDGQHFNDINWNKIDIEIKNTIFKTLVSTLEYIHSKKIIHADISPNNIIVTQDNVPIIIDFGISQYSGNKKSTMLEYKKIKAFNPKYSSPKLLNNESLVPDFNSDLFSLATVLYEMYSGQSMFKETSLEIKNKSSKISYTKIPFLNRFWFKNIFKNY